VTFEVVPPRIGAVGVGDVRDATSLGLAHVDLMVLAAEGPPFIGHIDLGTKRSGHSLHPALICPLCGKTKRVLYVVRGGRLACAGCAHHRSRQQRERTLASWKRGGLEEDQLLRLLLRPHRTDEALRHANEIVDELLAGDVDRLAALQRVTDVVGDVDASRGP